MVNIRLTRDVLSVHGTYLSFVSTHFVLALLMTKGQLFSISVLCHVWLDGGKI